MKKQRSEAEGKANEELLHCGIFMQKLYKCSVTYEKYKRQRLKKLR